MKDQQLFVQPIETVANRHEAILTIRFFIELIKKEEEFFAADQYNTHLMISRLRKIFYDTEKWDKKLIPGAAYVESRYHNISGDENENTPLICRKANQEIRLDDDLRCDIGHVFAGLDAINNADAVTPLPRGLRWAKKLFPSNDYNSDIVTWLGDLASVAGAYIIAEQNHKTLSREDKQNIIYSYAQGADMLGNIDAYAISNVYNVFADNGLKVSDILNDYYCEKGIGMEARNRRYSIFCSLIGLENWTGSHFENEDNWVAYNVKQLRNSTLFFSMGNFSGFQRIKVGLKTWFRAYDETIEAELLLNSFLEALKKLKKNENQISNNRYNE